MCPAEYVICSTCFTIASTGTHLTVDVVQNRGVCGGRRNAVGGVEGVTDGVIKVLGGVNVSVVGSEVNVA